MLEIVLSELIVTFPFKSASVKDDIDKVRRHLFIFQSFAVELQFTIFHKFLLYCIPIFLFILFEYFYMNEQINQKIT